MRDWLRRLRGVLGIGTLWGLVGGTLGGLVGLGAGVLAGTSVLTSAAVVGFAAGTVGFFLGSSFATALTLMERRVTLAELTPARAAGWGAIAGFAFPLAGLLLVAASPAMGVVPLDTLLLALGSASISYGVLTAGLAAVTVAIARRAPDALPVGCEERLLPAEHD